jgi:DNA-binding HxlR family transcriptional regulator
VLIEYALTSSGLDVIPVIYAAAEFSMKNFPEMLFEDGRERPVNGTTSVCNSNNSG